MNRCPFCHRIMDLDDRGLEGMTFYCPGCRYQEGAGTLQKLPDPEYLRREAGELEQLADDLEEGRGLAGRLRGFVQ